MQSLIISWGKGNDDEVVNNFQKSSQSNDQNLSKKMYMVISLVPACS